MTPKFKNDMSFFCKHKRFLYNMLTVCQQRLKDGLTYVRQSVYDPHLTACIWTCEELL